MRQYQELQKYILENGVIKEDRTGTGTMSTFGYQMRFDLSEGFPLVTTKDMMKKNKNGISRFEQIVHELLWFVDGDTDVSTLINKKVGIWTPDAYRWHREKGGYLTKNEFVEHITEAGYDLGPIYGAQWRRWQGKHRLVDQLDKLMKEAEDNPDSRRLILNAWNVAELPYMALPPCHVMFQLYTANGKASLQMYQRSGDTFLGVPFNIASYALLLHMIAQQLGLEVGELIIVLGDAHIYLNHVEQTKLQVEREPKPLPQLVIKRKPESIFDYQIDDFEIVGYDAHPPITAKVSVG
jgi:thymidylate synthase